MCTAAFASTSDNQTGPIFNDKQEEQYQQLKHNTSNFFGSVNKPFSIPNFLYGEPLFTPQHNEEQYEVIINRFFQTYPDLFQTTVNDFRVEIEQPKDRNITQVHLFQKYQSVPVFGAEAIFTFNDQHELISYLGKYIPNIDVNVKPNSTPAAVKQIVAQDLHIDVILQEPRLFIFNKGVFTNTKENTQLVWRLGTNGWVYFVNANTKAILYKYNDENSALSREVYTASGGTPSLPGTLVASEGVVISTISDDDVVEAYTYSEYVYNYFLDHFALDSYDGTGAQMVSTVDYDTAAGGAWCNSADDEDAAICPSTSQTIFADDMTTVDFVGHEWAHAVASYAVLDEDTDSYGLTHSDESGALSESYSDIFGVLIEAEYGDGLDWDFAEDSALGAVRNLEDPTIYGDPDVYSDYVSGGDTHDNAGIPNKAAYLIMREPSEGIETFNSTDVTGIGLEKAENIFYYALRDELIISATFDDNFNALLQTCLTLEVITIDTADCESIFDAYTAIGVNTDSSYLEADIATSTESGYAPLTVDFDGSDSFALNATITDYVWDFDTAVDSDSDGDSTNDSDNTGPVASNTYTSETNTHARLTITDDTLNSTYTSVAITVNNPIEPTFTVTGDHTTAPATVTFDASGSTDQTGTITDYAWDFEDGSSDSGSSVSHTFSSSGTYTVTLTVTDSNGYTNTATEDIVVYVSGSISSNTTWSADYDPYIVNGDLTIDSGYTFTIEPGTVIKFYDSASSLTVNGTLDAQGTSTDSIVFTSYQDDDYGGDTNGDGSATTPAAGDWRSIYFSSGSSATLDYITIQYGGRDASTDYPMLRIYSDDVTLSNCTLSASAYQVVYISGANPTISDCTIATAGADDYGIAVYSGAAPVLTSNTITDSYAGVYVSGSSLPTITNTTFTTNTYPIYWNADTLPTTAQLSGNTGSENTYAVIYLTGKSAGDLTLEADTGLIPLFDDVTIAAGDLLTINPGTIIKFADSSSTLSIYGELSALGETDTPIVFTSYQDDDYGGDTNGDGTATTPAANDWRTIWFDASSTGTIDQAVIRYGGRDNSSGYYYMVRIESDTVAISNSTLSDSETSNLYVYGATPTITNNTISNAGSGYGGISLVYYANATITDNVLTNNSRGIYLSNNSNPTITDNLIQDNDYGIYMYLNNGDVDTISNNLIYDNTSYGIYNRDSSATVMAESNWWGDASGPYNATSNPTGTGDTVSSYVDFDPWLTSDPTIDVTPPADVTLGTTRKDAWAQTITLNWTNPTDSDFDHVQIDRTDVTAGTTTTLSSSETGTSYIDITASYNTTYTYTLYTVDTSSNVSTGVTTANQRLRNPTPTNLTLTAGDTTIAATWNASSAPASTIGGYIVYYGTSRTALTNSVDVGNVTNTTLTGLTNYTRYFVAVTAYSKGGHESSQSGIRATRPHP